jgi:short-subunit dehydrogenase
MSLPAPSPSAAALVTGASSGIGLAISHELATRGQQLILVARRKDRLDALAAELTERYGIRAETLGCDLSKAASRAQLPSRTEKLGLDVEILINNAGFATHGAFHQADAEREIEQVRVLVETPVALTAAFLPAMVRRGRGAILNVSSVAAMQPLPYSAGYSSAKAYVKTFSEALHEENKGLGVTISALCPGPVSTDFWEIASWDMGAGSSDGIMSKVAWITPQQAAKEAVDGLDGGHRVIVPGLQVRAAMQASRYVPNAIKLPIVERFSRSKPQ